MKKIIITVLGLLSLFVGSVSAQQSNTSLSAIEPDILTVAYGKTTNIVFPYASIVKLCIIKYYSPM